MLYGTGAVRQSLQVGSQATTQLDCISHNHSRSFYEFVDLSGRIILQPPPTNLCMGQVAQVRRSALEISVALPCGWEREGQNPLLIIPYITPRSRSSPEFGKNTKFELRAISSAALVRDRLFLAPATMASGVSTTGTAPNGPFAGKPALRGRGR